MIDTDKEVKDILFDLGVEGNEYGDLVEYISKLLAEVKRLQKKVKKLNRVLTDLDEKIHNYESHVELMKAFEQGLELPETWKEMVE